MSGELEEELEMSVYWERCGGGRVRLGEGAKKGQDFGVPDKRQTKN